MNPELDFSYIPDDAAQTPEEFMKRLEPGRQSKLVQSFALKALDTKVKIFDICMRPRSQKRNKPGVGKVGGPGPRRPRP